MSINTSVTPLGDSLRGLADILDAAPSILTAATRPYGPLFMQIAVKDPAAVWKIGEDLNVPVHTSMSGTQTFIEVRQGPVWLTIIAFSDAEEVGS